MGEVRGRSEVGGGHRNRARASHSGRELRAGGGGHGLCHGPSLGSQRPPPPPRPCASPHLGRVCCRPVPGRLLRPTSAAYRGAGGAVRTRAQPGTSAVAARRAPRVPPPPLTPTPGAPASPDADTREPSPPSTPTPGSSTSPDSTPGSPRHPQPPTPAPADLDSRHPQTPTPPTPGSPRLSQPRHPGVPASLTHPTPGSTRSPPPPHPGTQPSAHLGAPDPCHLQHSGASDRRAPNTREPPVIWAPLTPPPGSPAWPWGA